MYYELYPLQLVVTRLIFQLHMLIIRENNGCQTRLFRDVLHIPPTLEIRERLRPVQDR